MQRTLDTLILTAADIAVDHDDALNRIKGHMGTGDLGRLSEGRGGMFHQEWNNTDGRARAFILVCTTDPRTRTLTSPSGARVLRVLVGPGEGVLVRA